MSKKSISFISHTLVHLTLSFCTRRFLLDTDIKNFNKFHPFKRYTKYTINTCKPFRWQQQPLFYGWNPLLHSSDHFNSQSNPRSPASCLLSLILLDLKQNIHTAIISKVQRFHLPSSILIIWNHTIYTFIHTFFLTKENLSSCMLYC